MPRKKEKKDKKRGRGKGKIKEVRKFFKKRPCRFCKEKIKTIDYKEVERLRTFISERGKIIPSRISGNCAKHQRQLTKGIKILRNLGLLAYSI